MTDAAFAALLVSPLAQLRLAYYTTFLFVCQEVFEKFFKFFWSSFRPSSLKRNVGCQLFSADLVIIPQCFPFVKGFLKVFKKLFRFAFHSPHRSESPSPMRSLKAPLFLPVNLRLFHCVCHRFFGSSSIIPHPPPFVNTFLQSFFGFFEVFCGFFEQKAPLWWRGAWNAAF